MSKGGPLVRFAHDAGRPLRIEEAHEGRRRTRRRGRLMREKALPFSLFFLMVCTTARRCKIFWRNLPRVRFFGLQTGVRSCII